MPFIAHAFDGGQAWRVMNAQEILMAHLSPLLFACALVLATGPAWSQQIRQPEPWGVQPAPRPVQPQVIPANPGQRPRSTSPVPGEGPAKLLPVQPPPVRTRPDHAQPPDRTSVGSGQSRGVAIQSGGRRNNKK